mmetsp:Transcript_17960/g.33707  ORF Transcript_17960/g.33707 Transcript_17960/m.33707 type:complete len:220 (-) Transcript_17960:68-727(-)
MSSFKANFSSGFPIKYDFIWMLPSMALLMTKPFALIRTDIRSKMSTKISFFLFFASWDGPTGRCTALLGTVRGFHCGKLRPSLGASITTASLWMQDFRCSVLVVWGYPKSTISSSNSYTSTKFFLMLSSLSTPQKSLKTFAIFVRSSTTAAGEMLWHVVATKYSPFFLMKTYVTPSKLKMGGASPCQNLTFLKKISAVPFTTSPRKSLVMIVSPRRDRM